MRRSLFLLAFLIGFAANAQNPANSVVTIYGSSVVSNGSSIPYEVHESICSGTGSFVWGNNEDGSSATITKLSDKQSLIKWFNPTSSTITMTLTYYGVFADNNGVCWQSVVGKLIVKVEPCNSFDYGDSFIDNLGTQTTCATSITISAGNYDPAYKYQWSLINGNIIPGATNSSYVSTSNDQYVVAITNTSGCISRYSIRTVVNSPKPVVSISSTGNTTFCSNQSITFTSVASNTTSYQWINNGVAISGATNANYTTSSNGNFYVRAVNSYCNTLSNSIPLTVNKVASAAITTTTPTTICVGGSVLLRANSGQGYSYQWCKNGTQISGETNATYSALTTGDYTLIVNSAGCGTATSTISTITVNSTPPQAIITPQSSTIICNGSSVQLNANTGIGLTYQWLKSDIIISGATASSYTTVLAGNYSVKVSFAGCFNISTPTSVIVNSNVAASITPLGPVNFCAGGSVKFIATNGNGFNYQWEKNGVAISGATNADYIANESGDYTVLVKSAGMCGANTRSTIVTVVVQEYIDATVNITSNSVPISGSAFSTCSGTNVTLSGVLNNGVRYQWYNSAMQPISGATNSQYSTSNGSNTYTLGVSKSGGCTYFSSKQFIGFNQTTLGNPKINISGYSDGQIPPPGCSDTPNTLFVGYSTGTCQWYKDGVIISGATAYRYVAVAAGSYTYETTDPYGCAAAKTSPPYIVSTKHPPSAQITSSRSTTLCQGQNVTLSVTLDPTLNCGWYGPTLKFISSKSSITVSEPGMYTVIVQDFMGVPQCEATSFIEVTVNPLLTTANITSEPSSVVCAGSSNPVYLYTSEGPGYSYVWQKNNTIINNSNGYIYYPSTSGDYKVIITSPCGTATSPVKTAVINDLPAPVSIAPAGPLIFCEGGSVLLNSNAINVGLTYQWKKGGVAISGATNSNYTAIVSGVYQLTVQNLNGCIRTSNSLNVVVNANIPPAINITTSPACIGSGTGTILSTNIIGSGASFQWYNSAGIINGATASSYKAIINEQYSCIASSNSGCGLPSVTSAIVPVTYTTFDSKIAISSGNSYLGNYPSITICTNSVDIEAYQGAGFQYQWYKNRTLISGATDYKYKVVANGTYDVMITDVNGCQVISYNNSNSLTIIKNDPTISLSTSLAYCTNEINVANNGLLKINSVISGTQYQWNYGGTAIPGASASNYKANLSGDYSVTFINSCGTNTSQSVHVSVTSPGQFNVSCERNYNLNQTAIINYTSCQYFDVGNTFTVQLSDIKGSFSCPKTIGTFTSQNVNGSIGITIPADAAIGNKYRIRIVSSYPAVPSSDNGMDIALFNSQGNTFDYETGFAKQWTNRGSGKIGGQPIVVDNSFYYTGDYDGGGDEEILMVSGENMNILKYVNNDWVTIWTNNGSSSVGSGIFAYRYNLIVGDFDGDNRDEILGNEQGTGWTTLFKYTNGNWVWAWSDYGASNHPIRPYKPKFYVGDFDGNGKDEILGCSSGDWTTSFLWSGTDFVWGWSDYGGTNPFRAFRSNMIVGNFDGDNKSDLLGFGSNAVLFTFDNNSWNKVWGSQGANNIGGWPYPFASTDKVFAANIDSDSKTELILMQPQGTRMLTMDLDKSLGIWNSNYQTNSFIGDWSTNANGGTNTNYFFVKAKNADPSYLMAMRKNCSNYDAIMYKASNTGFNYRVGDIGLDEESVETKNNILIHPNPSSKDFSISISNGNIYEVYIYNMLGELIYHEDRVLKPAVIINSDTWETGMYLIKVIAEDSTTLNSKVIIAR